MIYDCVNLSPSEQIGMHSQPDWELSYILQGHGRRQIGAAESPFSEGDMVLVVPDMPHRWIFEDNGDPDARISNISLMFGSDFLEKAAALPGFDKVAEAIGGIKESVELTGETKVAVARLLLRMRDEDTADRTASALRILSLLGRDGGMTVAGRFSKAETAAERIRKVKIYVVCNCRRQLTLDDAAKYAGMSRAGFCSFWKRETGETFLTFLTRQRLDVACHLLKNPAMLISEVCYESGFSDIPHFNRTFRRQFGVSPSAYRASLVPDTESDKR